MKPYAFTVSTHGEDTLLRGGYGTRFGGTDDSQDNGIGAWSFNVRGNPSYLGIALPIRCDVGGLQDSPLGKVPGGTLCRVYSPVTNRSVLARLVDIGPSKFTGRECDLMNSVVLSLGLVLKSGVYRVDVRIFGGAKHLPKMQRSL